MRLILILLLVSVACHAQEVLRNQDVLDLVKAGVAEAVIITKIRTSRQDFDTSSSTLIDLKKAGISDAVIVAMLESKTRVADKATEIEGIFSIREATNLHKAYIQSTDERSGAEISAVLKKAGYILVGSTEDADLIFAFDFQTRTADIGYSPGIFGGVYMRQSAEQRNGKLKVLVQKTGQLHRIFVRERRPRTIGKLLHKQAKDYTEEFLEELERSGKQ